MARKRKAAPPPSTPIPGQNKEHAAEPCHHEQTPSAVSLEIPSNRDFVASRLICGVLVVAVAFVFAQTMSFDFINHDDDFYVYANPPVAQGISWNGIRWAFTAIHLNNWHPLTWLSHMLDCQIYGLWPGGHHLTNVLLHTANTVLLFLLLRSLTGDLAPSAFVALVFAIHAQHVESVAWVAERKDVLSGFFFILTLAAYTAYVRAVFSVWRYALILVLFACGLMSKPMVVTLPCVLLLLDFWPLRRIDLFTADVKKMSESPTLRPAAIWPLLIEKIPLLIMSFASSVITVFSQQTEISYQKLGHSQGHIANAIVSYVAYIRYFLCPFGLTMPYLRPESGWPTWQVASCATVLVVISVGCIALGRRQPFLIVGWLWYLGTLIPVIGLIRVGEQLMADRYMYIPQIGLLLAFAWGVQAIVAAQLVPRWLVAFVGCIAIVFLATIGASQTANWRNSETLWRHTLASHPRNYVALLGLGIESLRQNDLDQASSCLREALAINPYHTLIRYNLALVLHKRGEYDEALSLLQSVVRITPQFEFAYLSMGSIALERGQDDQAISHFQEILRFNPKSAPALSNLGQTLAHQRKFDEANKMFLKALAVQPSDPLIHLNFGMALAAQGKFEDAQSHFSVVLKSDPHHALTLYQMGSLLAEHEQLDKAVAYLQHALEVEPEFFAARVKLGDTFTALRRYPEASDNFKLALAIKPGDANLQSKLNQAVEKIKNGREDSSK